MSGSANVDNNSVVLKCKGDKRFIKSNKAVLAKHSKYFEGLCNFNDREIIFDSQIVKFDILKRVVGYIERGAVKSVPMDELEPILFAADYLQADFILAALIQHVHQETEKRMQNVDKMAWEKKELLVLLRLYPILYLFEVDTRYQHTMLTIETKTRTSFKDKVSCSVAACPKFVLATNFRKIMSELPMLQLEEEVLYDLLSYEYLRLSEEEVLRVIKMWCYFNLPERRLVLEKMLKCVRADNPSVSYKNVMDELTCNCKISCDCLISKDFIISMLAHRLNTQDEADYKKNKRRSVPVNRH